MALRFKVPTAHCSAHLRTNAFGCPVYECSGESDSTCCGNVSSFEIQLGLHHSHSYRSYLVKEGLVGTVARRVSGGNGFWGSVRCDLISSRMGAALTPFPEDGKDDRMRLCAEEGLKDHHWQTPVAERNDGRLA